MIYLLMLVFHWPPYNFMCPNDNWIVTFPITSIYKLFAQDADEAEDLNSRSKQFMYG